MYKLIVCMILLGLTVGHIEVKAADFSQNQKWNTINNEYLDLKEQTDKLVETLEINKKNYQNLQKRLEISEEKLTSLESNLQELKKYFKKNKKKVKQIEDRGNSARYLDYLLHSSESNFIVRTGKGFGEVKKQNVLNETYQSHKAKEKKIKKQIKGLNKETQALRVEMVGNQQVIEEQEDIKISLLVELANKKEKVDKYDREKVEKGILKSAEASFASPSEGKIISTYGYRDGVMNTGIIIKNKSKESVPVLSIAEGLVTKSYFSNTLGNVITIQYELEGTLYETEYSHLNMRVVKVNDTVDKGTMIGIMGDTGVVSGGKQLHFKMFELVTDTQKPKSLNPLLYFSVPNN